MVKGKALLLLLSVSLLVSAPAARAADDEGFKVFWKEGLRMETTDKQFQLRIGGRIHNDWVLWSGEDDIQAFLGEEINDGTEFRRARLYIAGTLYEHLVFIGEYDFAGGDSAFKDVYLGLKEAGPVDLIRVGHFKEPFSLEEITSSNFTTFMERALPNVFAPSRNTGFGVNQGFFDNRMTAGLGAFMDSDDISANSVGDDFNITGRVTGLPLYVDEGEQLVHLGFAYRFTNPNGDALRIRQRPEVHLAPRFVDTDTFGADTASTYGLEAAALFGPFSVQGEYMLQDVSSTDLGAVADTNDPLLSGWYIFGSWVVTGEHRSYKPETGAFAGVSPERNFLQGGPGAIELALRYSSLDLDDEGLSGGQLDDITVGVNWYLNPNARVMFNYVHADLDRDGALDSVDDAADAFMTRFQINL